MFGQGHCYRFLNRIGSLGEHLFQSLIINFFTDQNQIGSLQAFGKQPGLLHIPGHHLSNLLVLVLHRVQDEIYLRHSGRFQSVLVKLIPFHPSHGRFIGSQVKAVMLLQGGQAGNSRKNALPPSGKAGGLVGRDGCRNDFHLRLPEEAKEEIYSWPWGG